MLITKFNKYNAILLYQSINLFAGVLAYMHLCCAKYTNFEPAFHLLGHFPAAFPYLG